MEETLIKQFSERKSKEKVQEFYEKALSILTSALEDLRKKDKKNSLDYDDTRIFPMGDGFPDPSPNAASYAHLEFSYRAIPLRRIRLAFHLIAGAKFGRIFRYKNQGG